MGLLEKVERYLARQKENKQRPLVRLSSPSLYRRAEELFRRDKLVSEFNSRGDGYSYFVMGNDPFKNAKDFEKIHIDLYRGHSKQPPMLNLVNFHVNRLGIDKNSEGYKALWLLSKRAGQTTFTAPGYHNEIHFKDVVAVTGNLLDKHQKAGFVKLTKQDMIITMASAIGHDLDHRGYSNPVDNKTFNEEESFRVMLPYLRAANMSENDIEKVHTILIATSPNGGNQYVKALAQAKREGRVVTHKELDPDNNFPQLKKLINNKKLLQMAAIVTDADLYASSGAGLKSHRAMNEALTKEAKQTGVKMDFNTNASSLFFFSKIVGEDGYASEIARKIANPSFKQIFNEIKDRVANENAATIDVAKKQVNGITKQI